MRSMPINRQPSHFPLLVRFKYEHRYANWSSVRVELLLQAKDTISNGLKSFSFNVVFEPEATQEEVFEHSGVKRMIDMALDG